MELTFRDFKKEVIEYLSNLHIKKSQIDFFNYNNDYFAVFKLGVLHFLINYNVWLPNNLWALHCGDNFNKKTKYMFSWTFCKSGKTLNECCDCLWTFEEGK